MSLPLLSLSILESRVGKGVENISFSYFPLPTPYGIFCFLTLVCFLSYHWGVDTRQKNRTDSASKVTVYLQRHAFENPLHPPIHYPADYISKVVGLFDCFLLSMEKLKRNYLFFFFFWFENRHTHYIHTFNCTCDINKVFTFLFFGLVFHRTNFCMVPLSFVGHLIYRY